MEFSTGSKQEISWTAGAERRLFHGSLRDHYIHIVADLFCVIAMEGCLRYFQRDQLWDKTFVLRLELDPLSLLSITFTLEVLFFGYIVLIPQ